MDYIAWPGERIFSPGASCALAVRHCIARTGPDLDVGLVERLWSSFEPMVLSRRGATGSAGFVI